MRKVLIGGAAIVLVGAMGGLASPALAASHARPNGVLIPAGRSVLPAHGGTADSLNWSGYAVTPGSGVTAVTSTFVVPSASLVPPGFAASWAGIGGYNTSDLIQAGVGENSLPDNPLLGSQYYAWYEILPASETPISGCSGDPNCTVTPGDKISVDIHNASGNQWSVNLADAGRWTYSTTLTYTSSGSSAEWIQEAPTVGAQTVMANVGTVHFGPTSTYTVGGATKTIAQGDPTTIDLSPSPVGGVDEATPSPLAADGQSFDVCSYTTTCPAP